MGSLTLQGLFSTPSPEHGKVARDGRCPDSYKTMCLEITIQLHSNKGHFRETSTLPLSNWLSSTIPILLALHSADLGQKLGVFLSLLVSHSDSFFWHHLSITPKFKNFPQQQQGRNTLPLWVQRMLIMAWQEELAFYHYHFCMSFLSDFHLKWYSLSHWIWHFFFLNI